MASTSPTSSILATREGIEMIKEHQREREHSPEPLNNAPEQHNPRSQSVVFRSRAGSKHYALTLRRAPISRSTTAPAARPERGA
jgi:hypothetical protein